MIKAIKRKLLYFFSQCGISIENGDIVTEIYLRNKYNSKINKKLFNFLNYYLRFYAAESEKQRKLTLFRNGY
jgi:hypothetical protein